VSVAAITLCVASQRVFIVVIISLSTESGNFWIYPRMQLVLTFILGGTERRRTV
jgi:hypothetical protein